MDGTDTNLRTCEHCGIEIRGDPHQYRGRTYCCRRCALRAETLREACRRLETSSVMGIEAVAAALDARDPYSHGHSRRVAAYAALLARQLGLGAADRRVLRRAALLHDVGKIGLEDAILRKPRPLNKAEWAVMRRHPQIGYEILRRATFLNESLPSVLHHHERWDGHGYPAGLAGEAIPLGARIIAVADAFDTMTTERPYRAARSITGALEEIRRHAGGQFDPSLAEAFAHLFAARWPVQFVWQARQIHGRGDLAFLSGLVPSRNGQGSKRFLFAKG